MTNDAGEPDGPSVDQRHSKSSAEDAEDRILARDPEVTPQCQLETASHRKAFDGGNYRFGESQPGRAHWSRTAPPHSIGGFVLDGVEVGTGTEMALRPGENRDVDVVIGVELFKCAEEQSRRFEIYGVSHSGTVDCDHANPIPGLHSDSVVAHGLKATVVDMRELLEERIRLWVDDPESAVEYAEQVDGRWAVRMSQGVRDATTVWFEIGERSLWFEAYVLPAPPDPADVHRQALVRNRSSWRAFFALDKEDAVVVRGRISSSQVTLEELDRALGEVYEMIELSFRPMLRSGFPSREKSD